MKSIKICIIGVSIVIGGIISQTFAITPLASKGVKTIPSANVDTTPPKRAKAMTTTNIKTWLDILPKESDKNYDEYVVIPGIGVVVPVIYTPTTDPRYKDIVQGRNLNVNDFLKQGVHHYPGTSLPGQDGNALIGGHSNFFTNQSTDFTTIFAQLPMLDANDQVWYYKRNANMSWVRYVYQVSRSYETTADDAKVFDAVGKGSQLTFYTCVPIGTSDKRWIVRAQLLFSQTLYYPATTEDYSNYRNTQSLDDQAQDRLRIIIGDVPATGTKLNDTSNGAITSGTQSSGTMQTGSIAVVQDDELIDGDFLSGELSITGSMGDDEEILIAQSGDVSDGIDTSDLPVENEIIVMDTATQSRRQKLLQWITNLFS